MRTIVVTSTKPYTGKSGICVALIGYLGSLGLDVGYFKPYGTMPVVHEGVSTDEDAAYVSRVVQRPSELADVCPVVRTHSFIESVLAGGPSPDEKTVRAAFDRCASGRDVMIVEGPTEPAQGACAGLSATAIAEMLDARVLLVDRPRPTDLPEDALWVAALFGERLGGLVLNGIDEPRLPVVRDQVVPFLESRGFPVLGVIAHDPGLSTVTVGEIVETLGGTVLTAADRLSETVETFMVGAMGQESALRFFRRKTNKAVITGGDRADVQLAALETSTRCIVLTGSQPPGASVMSRAEMLGVPMILVGTDTLTAVERIETLFGRVHLHDPVKAARIRELFESAIDAERLGTLLGVAQRR